MERELSPANWRVILDTARPGAWNMAIDEAILWSAGQNLALPTLRIYAWEPACLSLGYAEALSDVNPAALASHGWEMVRRPTGGKAVLHIDELTYSVAGPPAEPRLAGGVLQSYHTLSQALMHALTLLGVSPQALPKPTSPAPDLPGWETNPICFEVPSHYEITVSGKKLIGSAQARRKEGVLQHGSLPLFGDLTRITQVLAYPSLDAQISASVRLSQRAATLEQVAGRTISWDQAARAFVEAFQAALNLSFTPGQLSADEFERASRLYQQKYSHPAWSEKH